VPSSAPQSTLTVLVCFGLAALASCSSTGERPLDVSGGSPPLFGGSGGAVSGTSGVASGGVAGVSVTGGAAGETESSPNDTTLLPARVRRLATVEYDASVHALLGTAQSPATGPDFPPDLRQDGFTVNDAQRVDEVIIERLADAADALATEAQQNGTLTRLAPCAADADAEACATRFITSFGAKVYRRSLTVDEQSALLQLYQVGADSATYEDGIAHVTRGLLQSAGFLYLTELGEGTASADGTLQLTQAEIAASLSYFLTSSPPDAQLLEKAASGVLSDPAEREAQARRILETNPLAQDTVVRLVREWLGTDGIDHSAKDSLIYPDFEAAKPKIVAESKDFVRAVAFESTGTVAELFNANWTVNSGPLSLYETAGEGPIKDSSLLNGRTGILNQAAFLATYANAHESHPIFRGVALTRRVTCYPLDSPASFNLQVVPPAPDPTQTTRQRFSVHPADSICAGCHDIIDPYGFSFEHFDGMGAYRAQENGHTVDSSVEVTVKGDLDGPYADSNQLALAISRSDNMRECFARFMFRAAAATGDSFSTPGEKEFVSFWRTTPAAAQGNIVETLVTYVKQPYFATRAVP